MTREKIRDLIRKGLGETTSAFWSDVELNTWINDAGGDLCNITKCRKTNSKMTTESGTAEYSLSTKFSTLISIQKVYIYQNGSTWVKLDHIDYQDLDVLHPGWKSASSGTPSEYYWDIEDDILGLYVPPNSNNAGTDYVHVYYAQDFEDLTNDNDEPGIPDYLHMAIVHYVLALGFGQRGYGDKENDQWSKYRNRVRGYLAKKNQEQEDEEIIMKPYRNT